MWLLYEETHNVEGIDLCLEMGYRYLELPAAKPDYFFKSEDLAWSSAIIPSTFYFKTAILLIKMRALHVRSFENYLFLL